MTLRRVALACLLSLAAVIPADSQGTFDTGMVLGGGVTVQIVPFINGAGAARGAILSTDGTEAAPSLAFANDKASGLYTAASYGQIFVALAGNADMSFQSGGALQLQSGGYYGWSSTTHGYGTPDLKLFRDGADVLACRRTTNPCTFRVYNTFTDASNYERGFMKWSANLLSIGSESAGTGTARSVAIASGANIFGAPGGGNNVFLLGVNGFGYNSGSGAGGVIAQATDKTTGVTLNKTTGQITMQATALNTNTSVTFTLTNSAIAATDVVIVNIGSAASANSYVVTVDLVAAGSCRIHVRNVSGGSLSEALVLNFAVIKGANN